MTRYAVIFSLVWLFCGYFFYLYQWIRIPCPLRCEVYPLRSRWFLSLLLDSLFFTPYYKKDKDYWLSLMLMHWGFICMMFHTAVSLCHAVYPSEGLRSASWYFQAGSIVGFMGVVFLLWHKLVGSRLPRGEDYQFYEVPRRVAGYVLIAILFAFGTYDILTYRTEEHHLTFWSAVVYGTDYQIPTSTHYYYALYSSFLFYLPFTNWIHYILRFFQYYRVFWRVAPVSDSVIQKNLTRSLSWRGPHISKFTTWIGSAEHPEYGVRRENREDEGVPL